MKMRKKKHITRKPLVNNWYPWKYSYPQLTSTQILANIKRVIQQLREGLYGN